MTKKACAVAACTNNSLEDKSLSWHRFPKSDAALRNEWIQRCNREEPDAINLNHSRVCSAHFTPDDFERDFKKELMGTPGRRYLKANAIPLLHLVPDECAKKPTIAPQSMKRKYSSEANQKVAATACRNSKVIAKSKRTRKVDDRSYMTEEIVFEVDEDDDDDDAHNTHNQKVKRRKPEKGIFELSVDLVEDEEELTFPSAIPMKPGHSPNSTSDYSKDVVSRPEKLSREFNDHEDALNKKSTPSHHKKEEYNTHIAADPEKCPTESNDCDQRIAEAVESQSPTEWPRSIKKPHDQQRLTLSQHLERIFTPNQLAALMHTKKSSCWTEDEMFEAVKMRFFSLSMYNFLRKEKGYPFPGRPAINRWAKKMKLRGGTLHSVMKFMELGRRHLSSHRKDEDEFCVLSLGEMDVKETIEYDEVSDEISGPFKKMKVLMASSLAGAWQQPVYVDFDSNITKDTVLSVIGELYRVGYSVVCFASDCSDASMNLWNELGATMDRPCFHHPVRDGQVVVVPDSLHAIRLVRDNLLHSGFRVEDTIINRGPLDALVKLGVCPVLKTCHLRQSTLGTCETNMATQLFTGTVATALARYLPGDTSVATSTGNFLRVMAHWCDLMNVDSLKPNVPFSSPYGRQKAEQDMLLNHVKSVMLCLQCGETTALKPFQTSIIMSCNGISLLLDETSKHGVEYISTKWLNLTNMNELFSLLTSKHSEVPPPTVALYRLRLILFGHIGCSPETVLTFVAKRANINVMGKAVQLNFKTMTSDLLNVTVPSSEYTTANMLSHYFLHIIAEKINLGLSHKYPQLCKCGNSSLDGGHEPTAYFLGNLVKMENVFDVFTRGRFLSECKNVALRLTRRMRGFSNPLPTDVIKIFIRLRIEIYVRSLVPKLSQLVLKRQLQSKLLDALRNNSGP